jgi:hypothetical protein
MCSALWISRWAYGLEEGRVRVQLDEELAR